MFQERDLRAAGWGALVGLIVAKIIIGDLPPVIVLQGNEGGGGCGCREPRNQPFGPTPIANVLPPPAAPATALPDTMGRYSLGRSNTLGRLNPGVFKR